MLRWIQRICRWCVAAVLLVAAAMKATDLGAFAEMIGDFGLVAVGWQRAAAIVVTVLEALAGGLLLVNRRSGFYLSAALLVVFSTVLAYGLWLGLDVECGCLGPADRWMGTTLQISLIRNAAMLVALAISWREARGAG